MKKLSLVTSILTPSIFLGEGEPAIADTPEFKAALQTAIDGMKTEFDSTLQAKVDEVTSGLKTKNEELIGKLKTSTEFGKSFEGMDAEKVKSMMAAMENNEDMKLIADGKFEEVIAKRMDKVTAEFTEKLKAATDALEISTANENKYKTTLQNNTVKDAITKEALKAGVRPEALDDIVRRGLDIFSIDEKGEIESRNSEGDLIQVDGKLQNPERFMEGLKKDAPYYWGESQDSGAKGNKGKENQQNKGGADANTLTSVVGDSNSSFDLEAYRATRKENSGENYHQRK